MLSVLIPTYNYAVSELVEALYNQLKVAEIDFEILCLEDGSNNDFIEKNRAIENFKNTRQLISNTNLGRTKARQVLCDSANYDWLLFLDADVMPKKSSFIQQYLDATPLGFEAVYGGFTYHKTKPHKDYMLRWKYGRTNEEVKAHIRNQKPYKVIISANCLIKKRVFSLISSKIETKGYGFDNYYGALLKENSIKVLHIDNEVYHLGIEKSNIYLTKKEQAAETLLQLTKDNKIVNHDNSLLTTFTHLKKLKLNYLFSLVFKIFGPLLKRNLTSKNPSISILQIYRISYMCYKELNP